MDAGDVVVTNTPPKSKRFHPRQPKTFQIQHVFDLKRFQCPAILAHVSLSKTFHQGSACGPRKNLFPYSRRFRLPTLELFTFLHFHSESVCAELKSLARKRAAACRIEQLLFLLFESDHCQDLALVHHSTLIVK
jgi:hypothetical protein